MPEGFETSWRSPRRPGRESRTRGFWVVPSVGIGCILIFVLATMLREPVPGTVLTEPPPDIVGRWVTSDPRYADRGLWIGAREIVLGVGPAEPVVRGEILLVSVREENQLPVVYLEYDAGEGPVVMEMILEGNDRMHLRNPSEVTWTRVR